VTWRNAEKKLTRENQVREWQRRLAETFSSNGIVGGRLLWSVIDQEDRAGAQFVEKFKGYRVLIDSFFEFFGESLEHAVKEFGAQEHASDKNFSTCLLEFQTIFRAFRAAESLATRGYPLDAYALLRNVAEKAICIGAVADGITSFPKLAGTEGMPRDQKWSPEDVKRIRKARKKEERRIQSSMYGANSCLSAETIHELRHWDDMFDRQVHGSTFSMFGEIGRWMFEAGKPFSLGPVHDDDGSAMYFCRATEIAWFVIRTVPYLQKSSGSFGQVWADRWLVMDESIRFSIDALGLMGKKIAASISELVEKKLRLTPESYYIERN